MYNIYKIENKDEEEDEALQLPYEIKDFKMPYTMTIDTLQRLLKIKTDEACLCSSLNTATVTQSSRFPTSFW